MTTLTEIKIKAIDLLIEATEKELSYSISKNQYGLANQRQGFLDGLKEGKTYLTTRHFEEISKTLDWANRGLTRKLEQGDWGSAEYWTCCISALNICEDIIYGDGGH